MRTELCPAPHPRFWSTKTYKLSEFYYLILNSFDDISVHIFFHFRNRTFKLKFSFCVLIFTFYTNCMSAMFKTFVYLTNNHLIMYS